MLAELQVAVQTIKHGSEIVKGVMAADKALGEAELKFKLAQLMELLLDVRTAVSEANERLTERDAEIDRLKLALRNKEEVVKGKDAYYSKNASGQATGAPYCMKCFEVNGLLVHIARSGAADSKCICPHCKSQYDRRYTPTLRNDGSED